MPVCSLRICCVTAKLNLVTHIRPGTMERNGQIYVRVYSARSSVFGGGILSRFDFFFTQNLYFFTFLVTFFVRVYSASECIRRRSSVFGGRPSVFCRVRVYPAAAEYTPMDFGTIRVYSAKCASVFGGFECIRRVSVFGEAALQKITSFIRLSTSTNTNQKQKIGVAFECNQRPFECIRRTIRAYSAESAEYTLRNSAEYTLSGRPG